MEPIDQKQRICRQFAEVWNAGRVDLVDEYYAADFRNFGVPDSREALKTIVRMWRAGTRINPTERTRVLVQESGMPTDDENLTERIHALEVAQATQTATQAGSVATLTATQAGAAATQAAAQAGTMATTAAAQAGTVGTLAAGAVGLVAGIFLGLALRGDRR